MIRARRRWRSNRQSRCSAASKRPVFVLGHGSSRSGIDAIVDARGATRRADPHDVQSQGHHSRRPPARVRSARTQRHAGCELAHERVGPLDRVRCVVREPHRHRFVQADHPGRRRAGRARPVPLGHRSDARRRRTSRHGRLLADCDVRAAYTRSTNASDVAARGAIWQAENSAARGTTMATECRPPPCSRRSRATRPNTRSLRSTSATTPTRSAATSSASPASTC